MTDGQIGVIFDCDGTLLDSMGVWRELESELAQRAGVVLSREDTDLITTLTIPEVGELFHDRFGLGESVADVVRMIDEFMMTYYRERSSARPGALAFVQSLADRGVPTSVASSTPPTLLKAGLAHCGFAPYLAAIVSVEDVGRSKREPAVYDRAREALGTTRTQTWVFEDSVYAVHTAHAAGYPTVGMYDCDLGGTYEQLSLAADRAFHSFEELDADAFLGWTE